MVLVDLLGAALTLVALALLALGGYLAALRLLGPRVQADALALAVASLLLATVEAIGIGLLLGSLGVLRIAFALALQAVLVVALLLDLRRRGAAFGLATPLALLARRSWDLASHYWPASLLTLHGIGAEALRGLLRPPLSWDALSYHLVLTGTWLRDGNLEPVFGNIPLNYYGYVPANGSIWFWWWMAPSHSELYANLATLPHWLLLGLAAGAIARQLGATRSWPLAAFLTMMTPTVVRFAATEYVDILLAAVLLAGVFFGMRWLRSAAWSDAALFGCGLGLTCGTKVLGVAYALAAGGAALLLARGSWRRRVPQLAGIVLLTLALGSYFYLRNLAVGADALALACERTASGPKFGHEVTFPRHNSVADALPLMLGKGMLLDALLGTNRPGWLELGVGPVALLLLPAVLFFPLLTARERRREGWLAALLLWGALLFWLTVPFARNRHVYANIRYLIPCIGLAFSGAIAFAERRVPRERWLQALAFAVLAQDALQLFPQMDFGVRTAMAAADLVAAVFLLVPAARALAIRRRRELAVAVVVLAIAAAPSLARFRVADRSRALGSEFTAHSTPFRMYARAWAWLDAHAGHGNVAVVDAPNNYITYPTMGPRLERDARYININAANHPYAVRYPACQPRVDPDPNAWLRNLVLHRIRFIHMARYPQFQFPLESKWADGAPSLFALRYADANNRIYELTLPRRPARR